MVFLACSIAGDYGGLVVVVGRGNVGEKPVDAVCQGRVIEKDMVGQCGINMHHHHNNNTVTSLANSHVTGECIESPVHLHLLLPSCFN